MHIATFTVALSTLSFVAANSNLYSTKQASCASPTVHEVWVPAVTVTEWTTATAYAKCADCLNDAGSQLDVYTTASTPATALWSQPATSSPTTTLVPCAHWSHDASNPQILKPEPDTQMYYAPQDEGDEKTPHSFQWINATLSSPAVVLDQSSLLNYTWSNKSQTFSITFKSSEAFTTAQSDWHASMILVAYVEDCGDYAKGDSCYVIVKSLVFDATTKSCMASGEVKTFKQCLNSAKVSWGQYLPGSGSVPRPGSSSSFDYDAALTSIYSSLLSKYASGSTPGMIAGTSKTSLAYTPCGVITSPTYTTGVSTSSGSWYVGSGTITSTSTSGGDTSSSTSSVSSMTITTPPVTTTTSDIYSQVSSSLSSILSSLSSSSPSISSHATTETTTGTSSTISTISTSSTDSTTTSSTSGTNTSTSSTSSSSDTTPGITGTTTTGSSTTTDNSNTSTSTSSNTATSGSGTTSGTSDSATTTTTISSTTVASNCPTTSVDPRYRFDAVCLGPKFDIDLDSIDGFTSLSAPEFLRIVQLFPDLFSASDLTKRGFLDDAGDCFLNPTSCISSVASTIIASATSFGGGVVSSISSALDPSVVTSMANDIKSAADAAGRGISAEAAQIIAEIQQGLQQAHSFSKDVSIPVNIAAPDSALVESPWGNQVLIKSFGKGGDQSEEEASQSTKRDFSLNVFCVDCAITGTVDLQGSLEFDLTGITKLEVGAGADLDVNLGLGLDAKAEYSKTFSLTLFQQGIPELCSGTTLCIGPYVKLQAQLTLGVEAEGTLLLGGNWVITDASAQIYRYGGQSTSSNWNPSFEAKIEAAGEVTLSAKYGMPLSIGVGITILDGTISEDISLTLEPSITASATAAAKITSDGHTVSVDTSKTNGCDGIDVNLDWQVELTYDIIGLLDGSLYDTGPMKIDEKCIPWNSFVPKGNDTANSDTLTGLGSGAGKASENIAYVQLIDKSDNSALQICSNGDVYKVAPGYKSNDCSPNWLGYSTPAARSAAIQKAITIKGLQGLPFFSAPLTNEEAKATLLTALSVVADTSHRIPVYFPETMNNIEVGISRLRMVSPKAIPSKSTYVMVDWFSLGRPVDFPFAGYNSPTDLYGQRFTFVQCQNLNSTVPTGRNEVFLVQDPGRIGILQSNRFAYTITNGDVANCMPIDFVVTPVAN